MEPLKDMAWVFMSYGIWGLYHWGFLDPLALFTWGNVNSMLCPAISDPFYGPDWRMYALGHQFVLNLISGKFLAICFGITEVKMERTPVENGGSKVGHDRTTELLDNEIKKDD